MNEPAVELFSLKRFVKSTTSVDELPKEVTPKLGKSSTKNESSVLFPPKIEEMSSVTYDVSKVPFPPKRLERPITAYEPFSVLFLSNTKNESPVLFPPKTLEISTITKLSSAVFLL